MSGTARFGLPVRSRNDRRRVSAAVLVGALLSASAARAELTPPRPTAEPPALESPEPAESRAISVLLDLVIDADGKVSSATARLVVPADAPPAFAARAAEVALRIPYEPARRDGAKIRARLPYLMLFQPRPPPPAAPPKPPAPPPAERPAPPVTSSERDEDYMRTVTVKGAPANSPRGVGDFRIRRELLDASPRQQTSELLSAAPGFFVDHEDGEGLGNDVYLRGFDLEHGSGIEFRVSSVPINIPTHLLGQGYADLNFIIPEVVRSLRVLEGVYDPHQGDAAIVGSVDFDLGVVERGYHLKTSYGSFHQTRVVGIVAPEGEDEETFAAFALRQTGGFGPGNRPSSSASVNAQYAFELDGGYRVRLLTTAYEARASLAGVIRKDDLDAGRVGYFDTYPSPYAGGQSTDSSRVIVGIDLDHLTRQGGHFEATSWAMTTALRLRQNFTGNLESSQRNPAWSGRGDLLESTNDETAMGASARFQTAPVRLASFVTLRAEPGVSLRAGSSEQSRSLLSPLDLSAWDRRLDAGVRTLDLGGYVDLDARLLQRLRISGGLRADALGVSVDDRLANASPAGSAASVLPGARRGAFGVALSPRVSAGFDLSSWLTPMVSYGQGFRSLDARHLHDGETSPYSKVSSAEAGLRAHLLEERYVATLAFFETRVGNELVFDPVAGGLETQGASVRRGLVASVVSRPLPWLLGSLSFSANRATYEAATADGSHFVPSIPPLLFRADLTARRPLPSVAGREVEGRARAGFTLLSGRHLNDRVVGAAQSIVNGGLSARRGAVEIGVDVYNLLDRRYPDDEAVYISNWSNAGGQPPASLGRHITAAPPRTVIGTLSLSL